MQNLLFGLMILGLYWLYGWHPLLVKSWSLVDDGLYIRHAEAFLNWIQGKEPFWLGPFDCFLLAKTPLYGLWLAFLHLLGMPLRVGEFLLVLSGPFLFKRAILPIREIKPWEFAIIIVLLITNPIFPEDYTMNRGALQVSLTNASLIASVGLALRAGATIWSQIRWGLLTGALFALSYLNREEATWVMVPILIAFAILFAHMLIRRKAERLSLYSVIAGKLLILIALVAGFLPPVLTVCTLNKMDYGVFVTTFRRSSAFTGLYQRLTSLEPSHRQAYVPIVLATRMKAYAHSPTFAQLKPFLEEPVSYWTAGNGDHSIVNRRSPADREFFVSYFEFCLLHAAQMAGAKTGDQMESMFRSIDLELGQAIRAGKIRAGTHGPAILAAPVAGDYYRIMLNAWVSFSSLIGVKRDTYFWPVSLSDVRTRLDDVSRLTHSSVVIYPKTKWHNYVREPWVRWVKKAQRIIFPAFFLTLLGLLIWKRSCFFSLTASPCRLFLWTIGVSLSGLSAFCLSIAVVEVLGFKTLHLGGYNLLGYGPLSVLNACIFMGVILSIRRSVDTQPVSIDRPPDISHLQ